MSHRFVPFAPWNLQGLRRIHDHFAAEGYALFSQTPADEMFCSYLVYIQKKGYPVLCLLDDQEDVAGYGFLAPYGSTTAFDPAALVSIYIGPAQQRKGRGRELLQMLEARALELGVETVLANVVAGNTASLAFFDREGYVRVGCFRAVARKFGKSLDQIWLQKLLQHS